MFKFVVCLAVLTVSLSHVRAKVTDETEQALLAHLDGWMEECGKELNLDAKEIKKLHVTNGKLEGIDKCFVSCVLKKEGTINKEGKFDLETALEVLRQVVKNEDDLKIMEAASKTCLAVNDQAVSDGDKGCERAYNLVICIRKQKNQ
ncbi:general odorant-binding protein lush-like [Hyposmocoma kahamanoa]|uniref:general odorant-binding protein lush-like n=1 Tax=Hyposmocoma kahamanoa TaxID=1477025 RepID=UPI000E6DA281|nr:general odorant-binding protein lush-like [Hyposmocoma kahamanoa]